MSRIKLQTPVWRCSGSPKGSSRFSLAVKEAPSSCWGSVTIKLFNKYIKDEGNSILEVYCDNVNRDEIKGLLALLEKITFKYISVDAKSIKAIKEAHFREIYQARKKLEKEGFSWSEKP